MMSVDPETRRKLLELLYGLLPEDEAALLHGRIETDAGLAAAYAAAQQTAELLGNAARFKAPSIRRRDLKQTETAYKSSPVTAVASKESRGQRAATRGIVTLAAAILLLSLGSYEYHRREVAGMLGEHLRLVVAGPSRLQAAAENAYCVTVTDLDGQPVPATVEFAVRSAEKTEILTYSAQAGSDGTAIWWIPADARIPDGAQVEATASYQGRSELFSTVVGVEPAGYLTHLALDKSVYRPGEMVRCRAVTLARFSMATSRDIVVQFEVRDPRGKVVPGTTLTESAQKATTTGELPLPEKLAEGLYCLVARSPAGLFPEQRQRFVVAPGKSDAAEKPASPAASRGPAEAAAKPAPDAPNRIDVRFSPEGGHLLAGVVNRVYFAARTARGPEVALRGTILDDRNLRVADVETLSRGMGVFSFVPEDGKQYRLKIQQPAGIADEPTLPALSPDQIVGLKAGSGVYDAGKPLEFSVLAAESGLPLVAAVVCRGALVGEKTVITKGPATPVSITLPPEVTGTMRLTVYDCRAGVPRTLAERLVYRKPLHYLKVSINESSTQFAAGHTATFSVWVTNESGNPVPGAMLGISALEDAAARLAGRYSIPMESYFLLSSQMPPSDDAERTNVSLAADPKTSTALELLLGTRGSPGAAPEGVQRIGQPDGDHPPTQSSDGLPYGATVPLVYDNLSVIEAQYQERRQAGLGNSLRFQRVCGMASLVGGCGLLLLLAILSMLRIVGGLRLVVPAVATAAIALGIGWSLISPDRLASVSNVAVPFTLPAEGRGESPNHTLSSTARATQTRQDAGSQPDVAPDYSVAASDSVLWIPALLVGLDGEARVELQVPKSMAPIRLVVDAYGDERVGSAVKNIVPYPP